MADFYSLDQVKRAVRQLQGTSPQVHVQLTIRSPRRMQKSFSASIKGVYPNIFILSEKQDGKEKLHSCAYADVLTGDVQIRELLK